MALLMPAKRAWKHVLLFVTSASMLTLLGGCGGNTRTSSVTATASGIHKLVWQGPYTREDGTSLAPNEISEYRVYYKRVGSSRYNVINLTDPSITSLALSGFSSGKYDFRITAVDTSGLESSPSKTVEVGI